jgi:hypothetical protein
MAEKTSDKPKIHYVTEKAQEAQIRKVAIQETAEPKNTKQTE